jgi:hypothetical protein
MFIYTIQLEKNKFYVGKTLHPNFRIEQHFNKEGSEWTKKYKPIKVVEIIEGDELDEEKYTLKYMEKYGINNVRGGSFCQIRLSEENMITLRQIMNSVKNKCYICGKDHYANECNTNQMCQCITSYYFPHREKKCALNKLIQFLDEDDGVESLKKCYRCGRNSHLVSNCYAKTHIKGYALD